MAALYARAREQCELINLGTPSVLPMSVLEQFQNKCGRAEKVIRKGEQRAGAIRTLGHYHALGERARPRVPVCAPPRKRLGAFELIKCHGGPCEVSQPQGVFGEGAENDTRGRVCSS